MNRIDFSRLTPSAPRFLGYAAYFELEYFESLSQLIAEAPSLRAKQQLLGAAEAPLRRYRRLVEQLDIDGDDVAGVIAQYAPAFERFRVAVSGSNWWELLLGTYLTASMLNHFFARLAEGLKAPLAERAIALFAEPSGLDIIADELERAVNANTNLSDSLALWGRRVVGETLLVARSVVSSETGQGNTSPEPRDVPEYQTVEPVFTELTTGHTRRMDALGLSA